jgi:uncharacterized protein YrrD
MARLCADEREMRRRATSEAPILARALHDITGMRIHATDGDLGHVHDVYIEDGQWLVRYLQVDARHWLRNRHVLLAPPAVQSLDWEHGRIHVALTREQVRNSSDIDSHRPVSRQHQLHEYIQWPFQSSGGVWEGAELAAELHKLMLETRGPEGTASPEQTKDDPHLWSARALRHYGLEGTDGDLGRVDDFLVQPDAWTIRHIVIDRGSPLRAKRFLVPVDRIEWISWDAKRIRVTLGSETIGGRS